MNDAGTVTIVSLVSPYREDRDIARKRHEDQGLKFMEVFMDVPLDVVQDRDPKGLYKKVRRVCVCVCISSVVLPRRHSPSPLFLSRWRLGRSKASRAWTRPMSPPWSPRSCCPTTR